MTFVDSIDLLPWRAQQRARDRIHFFYAVGFGVLLTMVVMIGIRAWLAHYLRDMQTTHSRVSARVAVSDVQSRVLNALKNHYGKSIDELKGIRMRAMQAKQQVAFLSLISNKVPTGAVIHRLEMEKTRFTLLVCSRFAALVSQCALDIRSIDFVAHVRLLGLKKETKDGEACFDMVGEFKRGRYEKG